MAGRHGVSLLPGAAVVLTVWALVTSPAFPPQPWPPGLTTPHPHALAQLHSSEAPASGAGPSEQVLMEDVSSWEAIDHPLVTALGIQAEWRDSPSVFVLTRMFGVPPGPLLVRCWPFKGLGKPEQQEIQTASLGSSELSTVISALKTKQGKAGGGAPPPQSRLPPAWPVSTQS